MSALPSAQGQPIGLSRKSARDGVIGPERVGIRRAQDHFFRSGPFHPFLEGLRDELFIAEAFNGNALRRRRRQAERHFILQNEGEGGADMLASDLARGALPEQGVAMVCRGSNLNLDTGRSVSIPGRGRKPQQEPVLVKGHLFSDVDFVSASALNQLFASFAQELANLPEVQTRKTIG